jgi:arylformamidase
MRSGYRWQTLFTFTVVISLWPGWPGAPAAPILPSITGCLSAQAADGLPADKAATEGPGLLPAGVRIVRDVPYGTDKRQRFDVYHTAQSNGAPVIFMVHGGAWQWGDKGAKNVVENKVAYWVQRGFVFISTNYRMLPTDPVEQARDVARALAVAQDRSPSWGADRNRFILMGHSAGAHLVALLAADPSLSAGLVATPWMGVVSLDSAALNVVEIMENRHLRLYDRAFGRDPRGWRSASPFHALTIATRPLLLVCSAQRSDSCSQAHRFAAKAKSLNGSATVLEKDLSHGEINALLGKDPDYTREVESFLAQLVNAVTAAPVGR